jgi:hypothetical protein
MKCNIRDQCQHSKNNHTETVACRIKSSCNGGALCILIKLNKNKKRKLNFINL